MGKYTKAFRCEVLTAEGEGFVTTEAQVVVFPGADGQVGVLADRAPLIAAVGAGVLTVVEPAGQREYYVAGGFARVGENRMTLLADECMPIERIDPEQAWDEIEAARRLPADTREAAERRRERLDRARTKFRLAQKLRRQQAGAAGADGGEEVD
jgi:F-type H+-transporting ATPase subunit epsilon